MPLDRWISLYVAEPIIKSRLGKAKPGIPILMYHSISDDPETGTPSYYRLSTPPGLFREQMRFLRDNGYSVLSIPEVVENLGSETLNERRRVALTFDDGYSDFYSHAWPILKEFGYTATVFLSTAFVGDNPKSFKERLCLNWGEVRELHSDGVCFGSHTVHHVQLYDLGWPTIESELADSKKELEDRVGDSVDAFGYPYAYPQSDSDFCNRFSSLLELCGYAYCVTTRIGHLCAGDDRFKLKRLPVNGSDDQALFEAKLEGAYDWLAAAQTLVKSLKSAITLRRARTSRIGKG